MHWYFYKIDEINQSEKRPIRCNEFCNWLLIKRLKISWKFICTTGFESALLPLIIVPRNKDPSMLSYRMQFRFWNSVGKYYVITGRYVMPMQWLEKCWSKMHDGVRVRPFAHYCSVVQDYFIASHQVCNYISVRM